MVKTYLKLAWLEFLQKSLPWLDKQIRCLDDFSKKSKIDLNLIQGDLLNKTKILTLSIEQNKLKNCLDKIPMNPPDFEFKENGKLDKNPKSIEEICKKDPIFGPAKIVPEKDFDKDFDNEFHHKYEIKRIF
jgi:hypothetical protein